LRLPVCRQIGRRRHENAPAGRQPFGDQSVVAGLPDDAVVVPGHGEPTTVAAIDDHIAYLDRLKTRVEELIATQDEVGDVS
jgi:hypothetical protein